MGFSYCSSSETVTVTVDPDGAKACSADNNVIARTSGIIATAQNESGRVDWVELQTTITGSYVVSGTVVGKWTGHSGAPSRSGFRWQLRNACTRTASPHGLIRSRHATALSARLQPGSQRRLPDLRERIQCSVSVVGGATSRSRTRSSVRLGTQRPRR